MRPKSSGYGIARSKGRLRILGVNSTCGQMDTIPPADGMDVGTVTDTHGVETCPGHRSLNIIARSQIDYHIGIDSRLPEPDNDPIAEGLGIILVIEQPISPNVCTINIYLIDFILDICIIIHRITH